ncbi:MAG: hypothetical protein AB1304_11605 [Bacteroidota bacterium]
MILRIIISLILFSCATGEDEIVIVPKNYTGYIVIIYDQKQGAEPKYEGKKRLYEIPANGILKTQFTDNPEWTHFPEFYYEKISPENKIRYTPEPKNIHVDTVIAYGGIAGAINKDLEGKEVVRYVVYYIGNSAQIDTAYETMKKLDILKLAE